MERSERLDDVRSEVEFVVVDFVGEVRPFEAWTPYSLFGERSELPAFSQSATQFFTSARRLSADERETCADRALLLRERLRCLAVPSGVSSMYFACAWTMFSGSTKGSRVEELESSEVPRVRDATIGPAFAAFLGGEGGMCY